MRDMKKRLKAEDYGGREVEKLGKAKKLTI
jgi:hypothetical protein